MDNYKVYLKMQKPIKFYDICIIYQPTFDEILEYDISEFDKLLLPYCITIDNLTIELPEEEKNKLKNFDLVISSPEIVEILIKSLEYFCKSKIGFDRDGIFFEGFNGRLSRDNFDELAEIILEICARERPKPERIPIFANERQRDIWTKLQEGRKRSAKRNEVKLEDILNYDQYGEYYISKDEIKKFTLWEIMNCYKSKLGVSSYNDSFSIYLVSGEKSLIEGKHWTELIKLDYKPPQE